MTDQSPGISQQPAAAVSVHPAPGSATVSVTVDERALTTTHVTVTTSKPFEQVVRDLQAELGKTSTDELMLLLAASKTFEEYAAEIGPLLGRSNLIRVGFLDWGKVMSRVPLSMKAQCFIVGNPLTARKLLEAGGAEVGLYLPTKIFVYEDQELTHIAYDRFVPIMAPNGKAALNTVAAAIDGALSRLADTAAR